MAVAVATSNLEQLSSLNNQNNTNNSALSDPVQTSLAIEKVPEQETAVKEAENPADFEVWKKRELPSRSKSKPVDKTQAVKECSQPAVDERSAETITESDSEIELESLKMQEGDVRDRADVKSDQNGTEDCQRAQYDNSVTEEGSCDESNLGGESLKYYARKLGYSEAKVASAMAKLGPDVSQDSLLHELVKSQNSQKELEEGSSVMDRELRFASRDSCVDDPSSLRPIVIDGSNVAMSHGKQQVFSCRGIGIAVDWFIKRGHREITVFVPMWRKEASRPETPIIDQEVLMRLEKDGILTWTPSRRIDGRRITCYDDRFIVRLAAENEGVIVSNDNYRDLLNESSDWKKAIEQRLLMFAFVNDRFMPPEDPGGRYGLPLKDFLCKGCGKPCPYGPRCTYGNRCKFLHPERNSKSEAELMAMSVKADCKLINVPDVPYGEVTRNDTCGASRPGRPLPPPPDMPAYLLTKPLPPTPVDNRMKTKPLPLPPRDNYNHMRQMFPATLRNNQSINSQVARPASDPTPVREPCYDMNTMPEHFQQTLSMPSLERVNGMGLPRRGSLPQVGSYPEGSFPSLPPVSSHSMFQHQPHPSMACPPTMMVTPDGRPLSGEWRHCMQAAYQPCYTQQAPYQPQWPVATAPSYPPYPPQYHYSQNYVSGFQRIPYRGQGNGYYQTRGVPINNDDEDVVDGATAEESSEKAKKDAEELRIKAFEQLCEVFPDSIEKILQLLEDNPKDTSVEKLTQLLLDEETKGDVQ
ncbi:probable ribonuclease ZC3H12B isoform X2 [Nematostella vectensis]|nr:probable ribonuclease ZC3H12B isoform X2 [Nematostella vectensis]